MGKIIPLNYATKPHKAELILNTASCCRGINFVRFFNIVLPFLPVWCIWSSRRVWMFVFLQVFLNLLNKQYTSRAIFLIILGTKRKQNKMLCAAKASIMTFDNNVFFHFSSSALASESSFGDK
jgi:hypothetical protein